MDSRLGRMAPPRWLTPSVAALVVANLVPLAGVLWLRWEVGDVVLLYWIENLIVGGFNVLRMLAVRVHDPAAWFGKLVLIPFFLVHYGGFAAVHGVLLTAMFKVQGSGMPDVLDGTNFDSAILVVPLLIWGTMLHALSQPALAYGATTLIVSRAVSFLINYLGAGEYRDATMQDLMVRPYKRVIFLHLVVIGSGFLLLLTGSSTAGLLLMVLAKIGVDVTAHCKEHATA